MKANIVATPIKMSHSVVAKHSNLHIGVSVYFHRKTSSLFFIHFQCYTVFHFCIFSRSSEKVSIIIIIEKNEMHVASDDNFLIYYYLLLYALLVVHLQIYKLIKYYIHNHIYNYKYIYIYSYQTYTFIYYLY